MGNCCDGKKNLFDVLNLQLEKDDKSKNPHFSDFQSHTDYNLETNTIQENNIDNKDISPSIPFISKKKLKLKILQSKCLVEGKTYIINSLGLIESKNNHNDGLTIFGDENVYK